MIDKVISERTATCGEFSHITETSQLIKDALRKGDRWHNMPLYMREALDMIAHKMARIANGSPFHADHWTDIIGYSTLVLRENGTLSNYDKGALCEDK